MFVFSEAIGIPGLLNAMTSQIRIKDAYFCRLMDKQPRDPSDQEEDDSEDAENPATGILCYKEKPVVQNNKAWEKPFAHKPVLELAKKIEKYGSDMG